ncbi:MAG: plasmid pRiA4b ORF-3 family protein [Treponema sp.]|nr:plasmid pRiA4b ORF-3 family protein [Treponema sp.]
MTKQERLDEKIDEFISRQNSAFCLDDIAKDPGIMKVGGKSGVSQEEIQDLLLHGLQVFSSDSRTFIPRHLYFKDAQFLISPTDEEIGQGILIPGHRFFPFCAPFCYPWECSLFCVDSTQVGKVPQKVVALELAVMHIYFTLVGVEHMGEFLCEDQPSNLDVLESGEISGQSRVQITVFDLRTLYHEWGFKRGDAILCETHNWTEGIYTISYLSEEKRRGLMASSTKWISALETGFHKVFHTRGFIEEIDEQIAYAYYYAGTAILKTPPIHLGGFIELTNKVHILSMGFETKLWYEKDLKFSQYLKDIGSEQPSQSVAPGSLEALLDELNVSYSAVEIEAFLRDEFFRHKGMIAPDEFSDYTEAVILRIFGDRAKQFSEKQWAAIEKLFRKLWTKVSKSYNYFKDQVGGKVRNGLLVILEDYSQWMSGLSRRFTISADSPVQQVAGLGQYIASFTAYFELLNNIGPEHEEDAKELYEILPRIHETIEMMKQSTEEQLSAGMPQFPERPQLHLVQPDDDKPKHIFVFRITLKDTRPLIWRTVQIPGCFTLGELHYVIQDIMDWTDAHSHCFEINEIHYGSCPDHEFSSLDIENEHTYTLDSLNLADKQCFTYVYDFGDQWVHDILVSKIMPSSDFSETDWRYPVCLSGKRSSPPEGCGGLTGYEQLIEAFNAPHKKKSSEILAYYPNFDPDFFDVGVINEILYSDVDGDE